MRVNDELRRTHPSFVRRFGLLTLGLFTTVSSVVPPYSQPFSFHTAQLSYLERAGALRDSTMNLLHPFAFTALRDDQDTFTLSEVRRQPDWTIFVEAMTKEMKAHEYNHHWIVIPSKTAKITPVQEVWSFKRKINPLVEVVKYKARLNAHGGQTQYGVHYWDTFAPVVQWFTIRILLIVSIIENLNKRSVDFVLAFPQADIKVDVYMRLPFGYQ